MDEVEVQLSVGGVTDVVRVGVTVRRPVGQRLLRDAKSGTMRYGH